MTQVVETDEAGWLALSPELLGEAKSHNKYVVETLGKKLVVEPEATDTAGTQQTNEAASEEWMRQWRELSEEIGKVWPKGVSAADVISEMRR